MRRGRSGGVFWLRMGQKDNTKGPNPHAGEANGRQGWPPKFSLRAQNVPSPGLSS
uniref:Uncharacterized protein n=1 Tax=Arundo donax TaxID=35708 RepID=A0A0A9SMX5_ARUDO